MKTAPEFLSFVGPEEWIFFDDFNDSLERHATALYAKWDILQTGGETNGAFAKSITETGGILALTQDATDNDVMSMIANCGIKVSDLKAGYPVEFGVRFKVTDADECHVHLGLGIVDESYQASAPADYIAFRLAEGSAGLDLVCSKDSAATTLDNMIAIADDTWARAFFRFLPTSTTDIGDIEIEVHSNGSVQRATLGSAGNFPDDVIILPVIQFQNGAAAADVLPIDWIYAKGTRNYTPGTG